jgi:hypothetical protein
MSSYTTNRRTMVLASALAIASPVLARNAAFAQSPAAADQSWTTELFGRQVAWGDPWTRDESVPSIMETDFYDSRVEKVVGRLFFDRIVLQLENGATSEMNFVPSPGDDRSWNVPYYQVSSPDVDIEVESGSTDAFWYYGIRFFVFEGLEYGRFVTITDPYAAAYVQSLVMTAPVAELGAALQAYQDSVTIDGTQPISSVVPADVQSLLDPLIGTGGQVESEATPGT